MEKADEIMDKAAAFLKYSKSIYCKKSNPEFDCMCKDFAKVLTLWDGVFSIVHNCAQGGTQWESLWWDW